MATIYLLRYNNYYNRQLKHIKPSGEYLTYDELVKAGASTLATFSDINFKWGDGVNQELILNYDCQMNAAPDYCLISDGVDKGITSVWFILESSRLRNGQFKFTLYRDLINTYYENIVNSPMFIEKATLPNDSPFIFNSENMTYNQIKKEEHLLPDKTGCPWLVGYFASNTAQTTGNFSLSPDSNITVSGNHTDWEYFSYTDEACRTLQYINTVKYIASYKTGSIGAKRLQTVGRVLDNTEFIDGAEIKGFYITNANSLNSFKSYISNVTQGITKLNFDDIQSQITGYNNDDLSDLINNYNGKQVQFDDGVYKINIRKTASYEENINNAYDTAVLWTRNRIKTLLEDAGATVTMYPDSVDISINVLVYDYIVEMQKVAKTTGEYHYQLSSSSRQLDDAPYKMFAIPFPASEYNDGCYVLNEAGTSIIIGTAITKDLSSRWITDLAKTLGSNLYDVQVVPYCPIVNSILGSYAPDVKSSRFTIPVGATEGIDFMYLYDSNNVKKNICFFPRQSTFSFSIQYLEFESGARLKPISDVLYVKDNIKIQSETEFCRLTSPNFNGNFEFNIAKNGGCDYFNIDCTYKPYTPYIQIQPNFGGLYGQDFNDARGLILNGDFSVPIVNDQWKEYEIQNKNYQQIFNRQIENMEVNNSIDKQEAGWQIAAGSVQGAVSGGTTGALVGGGYGAAAGALVGGGTALASGVADYVNLQKRQAETMDYTHDLFGYQLGNIKALPYNLTKVSSLNAISKYFPFIEVYDCTKEEKTALQNKLDYNGMSVGVIGFMKDYIYSTETYIKGKIIRLEYLDIDYHEAIVIAEELNKGVFI